LRRKGIRSSRTIFPERNNKCPPTWICEQELSGFICRRRFSPDVFCGETRQRANKLRIHEIAECGNWNLVLSTYTDHREHSRRSQIIRGSPHYISLHQFHLARSNKFKWLIYVLDEAATRQAIPVFFSPRLTYCNLPLFCNRKKSSRKAHLPFISIITRRRLQ
jgi:hypothetical protein